MLINVCLCVWGRGVAIIFKAKNFYSTVQPLPEEVTIWLPLYQKQTTPPFLEPWPEPACGTGPWPRGSATGREVVTD